jgi:hypothetical protein
MDESYDEIFQILFSETYIYQKNCQEIESS